MITSIFQIQTGGNTFIYFSCLHIAMKIPAVHRLCLTVSMVVYTAHVHYQPPLAPTYYKYVRELLFIFIFHLMQSDTCTSEVTKLLIKCDG
jgi:hypothetical protein